ncbi:hypothetical protein GQ457_09G011920 [Hibiscus cannabinus]
MERILNGNSLALPGNALVDDIRDLLSRDWEVIIRKIPKEMNKVTDALARLPRDGLVGVVLFDGSLITALHLVLMDKQGVVDVMVGDGLCRL